MSKAIVVYYSLEGNVDFVAKKIAQELGADTLRLETVKEYPKSGLMKFFHGGKDVVAGVKPELKTQVPSLSDYDTVVIGCPVWASKPASPVSTFLDTVDLAGKKCFAFASSAGGNAVKCLDIMAAGIKGKGGAFEGAQSFVNPLKKQEEALAKTQEFVLKIKQA
ncbi:MAG: flavodoxin [Treponema sp.]|nr:flavodoxin [Treponema sp.]